jgi:hypothetical protein
MIPYGDGSVTHQRSVYSRFWNGEYNGEAVMKCANIIERGDDVGVINESVVVLGGGGIWGVAWMTGTIMGLAEHGIDLTQARAFIGTSAGSIVGIENSKSLGMVALPRLS